MVETNEPFHDSLMYDSLTSGLFLRLMLLTNLFLFPFVYFEGWDSIFRMLFAPADFQIQFAHSLD